MIRSLPLTALSLLLGFFFIFVGLIKITPKVNPDIYRDMVSLVKLNKKNFIKFCLSNKNLVVLTKFFHFTSIPDGDLLPEIFVYSLVG